MKISNETKTGLFVLICLAALFGLLIKVGNFTFFKQGYEIKTLFKFSGGVKKNAPVRLSGVDVGEVRGIRLLYGDSSTEAEVTLWLEEGTKVRKDAIASVATLGLMGEKYVEIKPGASQEFVSRGEPIQSDEPFSLEELVDIGKKVAADISKTSQDISKVANRADEVIGHVDDLIKENRPKIDGLFDNLEETAENFNDFSQDVKYHPWKVLMKGKEVSKDQLLRDREARRVQKAKQRGKTYEPSVSLDTPIAAAQESLSKNKKNFSSR